MSRKTTHYAISHADELLSCLVLVTGKTFRSENGLPQAAMDFHSRLPNKLLCESPVDAWEAHVAMRERQAQGAAAKAVRTKANHQDAVRAYVAWKSLPRIGPDTCNHPASELVDGVHCCTVCGAHAPENTP